MEIKTKFDLGEEAFRVISGSGTQRPIIQKEGMVIGYQITQHLTEAIIRYSGTDKSYMEDELLTQAEANEYWSNLMRKYTEELKREVAECEKQLEDYEKWKSK